MVQGIPVTLLSMTRKGESQEKKIREAISSFLVLETEQSKLQHKLHVFTVSKPGHKHHIT